MKRLSVMFISVGLLAAACGTAAPGSLGPVPAGRSAGAADGAAKPSSTAPAASARPGNTPEPASIPPSAKATPSQLGLQVWFTRNGKLLITQRTMPATVSAGRAALDRLLAGPSAAEAAAGVRSQLPAGTTVLGLRISTGIATVDLSSPFGSAGSQPTMPLQLAQLVYTLTQFPTVTGVRFEIDGTGVTVAGGVPVQDLQTRAMYGGYLPPITVTSPVIGEVVASPVTVSGTADVYEAVVSVRILDSAGNEIARTFGNASCGTGCRGAYSVTVSYTVPQAEPGTMEVFESSAKNGLPLNVQQIPVTLTPGS